jgi:hypothetical protein
MNRNDVRQWLQAMGAVVQPSQARGGYTISSCTFGS